MTNAKKCIAVAGCAIGKRPRAAHGRGAFTRRDVRALRNHGVKRQKQPLDGATMIGDTVPLRRGPGHLQRQRMALDGRPTHEGRRIRDIGQYRAVWQRDRRGVESVIGRKIAIIIVSLPLIFWLGGNGWVETITVDLSLTLFYTSCTNLFHIVHDS